MCTSSSIVSDFFQRRPFRLNAGAFFAAVVLTVVSCVTVPAAAQDAVEHVEPGTTVQPRTLEEITASGELVILTFPHQQSVFSRTNLSRGVAMPRLGGADDFVGIDIDLMSDFAERLGVTLRIRPVSEPRYAALIPDLLAGRGDLIASSLTITDERRKKVDFSTPYFEVYPVIVTRDDLGVELNGPEDLKDLMAVVTAGSSHEERLLELGVSPASLVRVDFTIETFAALLEEDADFTLADSTSAMRYLADEPTLRIAFRLPEENHYGFAVPQGSELKQALDSFLEEISASGTLESVFARHIGSSGASSAGAGTGSGISGVDGSDDLRTTRDDD